MDKELVLSLTMFCGLLSAYVVLTLYNFPQADLVGDLLKYVTIAIISYYFGKSSGAKPHALHVSKEYLFRGGLIGIGFGIALIVSHAVLFGIDPIWKDPLGHEWIGVYILIASMIVMGYAKSDCKLFRRTFTIMVEKDEGGYYVASVKELPGCHTQARTMEELLKRICEAIIAYSEARSAQ